METEESISLALRVGALIEERRLPFSLSAWLFSGLGGENSAEEREGISFHKTSSGTSSPGSFSQEILAKYSDFLASKDFETFRTVAIKLLNRVDHLGTFRMLEREIVLQGAVLEAMRFLELHKPLLLVFPVTPHLFLPYVAANVADFLGLSVMHFQPCPIAPVVFPKLISKGHSQSLEPEDKSKPGAELVESARVELARLRRSQEPTYIRLQKKSDAAATLIRRRMIAVLRTIESLLRAGPGAENDFVSHRISSSLLRRALRIFFIRTLRRELRRSHHVASGGGTAISNYSIYALHYEPERTSLPDGLPILFQADAIAIARSLIPAEQKLIVKEHYSQTSSSLRGYQGRSPRMYQLLQSYEGVALMPAKEQLADWLSGAKCVFTLTGTIAIEAVMRGVPVAYFGSPWWAGMPGTVLVSRETKFSEILSTPIPTSDLVEGFLVELIEKFSVPGLGGESKDSIERKLGGLSPDFLREESAAMLDLIARTVETIRR